MKAYAFLNYWGFATAGCPKKSKPMPRKVISLNFTARHLSDSLQDANCTSQITRYLRKTLR